MTASLPRAAECLIVGGGAVGCSLAYHLARAGMKPLLLERGELGAGSTGRCAGGVRQQFSTAVNVRVGIMSRRMLERFEDEIGVTAGYRPIGYVLLASDEEQAAQFRRNIDVQHRAGLDDVRMITPAEVSELVPGMRVDDLVAATHCPTDGLAGPSEVTLGYAAAARRHGATIVEGLEVDGVDRDRDRVLGVHAAGQRIDAEIVVNCAGPHAGVLAGLGGVQVPVKPYRRHIFVTEPFSLGSDIPMTVDFRTSFYFHPEGLGMLLGMSDPAEPSSFDTTVDWRFLEHLVEHAAHRLPPLADSAIATGWAGLYEVTPDHQAIVGEHPQLTGFWLCCGFSGHGFMQAPAIGRLLADRLVGRPPEIDLAPFAPGRFAGGSLEGEAAVI